MTEASESEFLESDVPEHGASEAATPAPEDRTEETRAVRPDPSDVVLEAGERMSLEQIQAAWFRSELFNGPLPHPEHFAAYDEIMPGSAERILALAERQAAHRQSLEAKAVDSEIRIQARGQWMAFVLSTITIGGGVFLIGTGQPIEGAATALTALASLVGLFVWSKKQESKERAELQAARSERAVPPPRDEEPAPRKEDAGGSSTES